MSTSETSGYDQTRKSSAVGERRRWFKKNGNLTKFDPILPTPEPNPGFQLREIADYIDF